MFLHKKYNSPLKTSLKYLIYCHIVFCCFSDYYSSIDILEDFCFDSVVFKTTSVTVFTQLQRPKDI